MAGTRSYRKPAPETVDRKVALVREQGFVERFTGNMNVTPAVYNPLDNRIYDAGIRNRVMRPLDDRSQEVKAMIRKLADRDLMRLYEEMPKNPVVLYEIWHQQVFSTRALKVVVAGASVSPVEELIRKGTASQPARPDDLQRLLDLVATQQNVFYYIGAFATTGWADARRQILVGGNYLAALCDMAHGAWRTCYGPDPRWRTAMKMFDLATDEEKVDAVRQFVRRNTSMLLMDEMSEDFVAEELGAPIAVVREAFETIASEDRFVRYEAGEVPHRLVRVYG